MITYDGGPPPSNSIAIRERSQFATCPRSGARPDFRPVLFRSNVRGVENDRDCCGRGLDRKRRGSVAGDNYVDLPTNQVSREFRDQQRLMLRARGHATIAITAGNRDQQNEG